MRSAHGRIAFAIAALVTACSGTDLGTGLMGTMTRGPILPVCAEGTPCTGPLAAHFEVFQGGTRVAAFDSDANGQYRVMLVPGVYRIVPADNAPIMDPSTQDWTVEVKSGSMSVANFEFDTGIR